MNDPFWIEFPSPHLNQEYFVSRDFSFSAWRTQAVPSSALRTAHLRPRLRWLRRWRVRGRRRIWDDPVQIFSLLPASCLGVSLADNWRFFPRRALLPWCLSETDIWGFFQGDFWPISGHISDWPNECTVSTHYSAKVPWVSAFYFVS